MGSGGTTLEEDRKVLAAAEGDQPTRQSIASHPGVSEHMAEVASSVREGDVLVDRYRVMQRIGKGGMGEVFLAEHVAIGRQVAIKILLANVNEKPDLAKRFLQEARTASKLRHANVVDIIDFGHVDAGQKTPFFVMEYLEGTDLKGVVKAEKILPWSRARDIALQICAGLAVAHAQGFIHRDLKPDNVYLIRDESGKEIVKILDFGIAKIISDEAHDATQTGVLLGTPEYMSPEQAEDKVLDARSDIYALGVILYRMLVGRVPFQSKAFMTVLAKHIQEKPMPPREAAPEAGITAAQEAVILKCLAKKPEERYQSADALAAALRAASGESGAARGRGAIFATVGVAVVAAIVVGLALASRAPEVEPEPPVKAEPAEVTPPVAEPVKEPVVVKEPDPVPVTPPVVEDPPPVIEDPPPTREDPPTKGKPKPTKGKGEARPKDALSAADLRAGFKSASGAVKGCPGGIAGTTVKVDVTIAASGAVESATAHKPHTGSPLGRCVEKAAKTGKFPVLTKQLRVTYPFEL